MLKMLPYFAMVFFVGALAVVSAAVGGSVTTASAEPQYSTSDNAQLTRVADLTIRLGGGGERVCCKRGWRDWWSTRRECRRAGGYQTANRECRDDRDDRWNVRVCCKRGHHDWWSTLRECRRQGGYQTANRECRRD